MVILTVEVTPECEGLITAMPRGYEYELVSEDYEEDGSGTVVVHIHDVSDTTAAMERALDTHPGVIRYRVD